MYEIALLCPEPQVELVCDALSELDALSVSVEDADADTDQERPLFGEPGLTPDHTAWARSRITALFAEESGAQEASKLLAVQDFFADCAVLHVHPVPEQDWVRITQAQFAPVPVTDHFFIVPTWCEPPAQAKRVIRLDPGLAFGTGTHPTTWMCLKWIAQQNDQTNPRPLGRTLDYGCGSGILAIAAQLHGASAVDAVDIDPAAVQSTQDNAHANQVRIDSGLPDLAQGQYDTVLANILASPLKVLAPLLCGHVAAKGRLVLAGILERQAQELQDAYAPFASIQVLDRLDGWVLMGTA